MKRHRLRDIGLRVRPGGEAAHPNLVAPEQMAECLLDRAEESTALALPLLRREPVGNSVNVFVLPAVVARHALYKGAIDHRVLLTVMPGHNRSTTASLCSPMSLHLGPPGAAPQCRP